MLIAVSIVSIIASGVYIVKTIRERRNPKVPQSFRAMRARVKSDQHWLHGFGALALANIGVSAITDVLITAWVARATAAFLIAAFVMLFCKLYATRGE